MLTVPLSAGLTMLTGSWQAGLLCFIAGVLIDLDHGIEYLIHYGLNTFNFKEIYQICNNFAKFRKEGQKFFLFFHALEIAILLWIAYLFWQNIYVLSFAIGYTGHLFLDVTGNILKPSAYFISSRIKNRFTLISFLKDSEINH
ncbi:hypothetical protein ACFL1I_01535 [Candidatus Omnitrophota bacterium]